MLKRLNEELSRMHQQKLRRDQLARRVADLRREEAALAARVERLDRAARREEQDVERLQGLSLTGLFYTMLGSKEEQLDRERQEALAARLKHDEAAAELAALRKERDAAETMLAKEPDVTRDYEQLLAEKERLITKQRHPGAAELFRLSEEEAGLLEEIRQLEEAFGAGRVAQAELRQVVGALESAHGWGMWDMFGGGLLATAAKHSRMDDAKEHVYQAQQALSRFSRELRDVQAAIDVSIDVGGLARFADYFFDGLIVDWVVQSRINDSLQRSRESESQVTAAVQALSHQLAAARSALDRVRAVRWQQLEQLE